MSSHKFVKSNSGIGFALSGCFMDRPLFNTKTRLTYNGVPGPFDYVFTGIPVIAQS